MSWKSDIDLELRNLLRKATLNLGLAAGKQFAESLNFVFYDNGKAEPSLYIPAAVTFPPEGWTAHPSAPGYFYKGQEVVTEAELHARYGPTAGTGSSSSQVPAIQHNLTWLHELVRAKIPMHESRANAVKRKVDSIVSSYVNDYAALMSGPDKTAQQIGAELRRYLAPVEYSIDACGNISFSEHENGELLSRVKAGVESAVLWEVLLDVHPSFQSFDVSAYGFSNHMSSERKPPEIRDRFIYRGPTTGGAMPSWAS